ncbi:hypothetical protein AB0D54_23055, partial [Streptomyces xanthophaeus]|uniref:hypothetical protein n=1 Tax=Streptomyces xanthophaeus TaxID=67385 RepID=UPI00343CFB9F
PSHPRTDPSHPRTDTGNQQDTDPSHPRTNTSNQQACENAGGIWAENGSGGFYCGKFNKLEGTRKDNPPNEQNISPEDAQKRLGAFLHFSACAASGYIASPACQAFYKEAAIQGGPIWDCIQARSNDWFVCLGATQKNPIK